LADPKVLKLAPLWHSPSNAHAYRLLLVKEQLPFTASSFSARSAVISEERDYDTLLKLLSTTSLLFFRSEDLLDPHT
jgi:hypothetical protein